MSATPMTILPYGDQAVLVNFDQRIDEATHAAVMALADAVVALDHPGVTFIQPAYCSLAVGYNPTLIDYATLHAQLLTCSPAPLKRDPRTRTIRLPVCYEAPYALDRDDIQQQTGLTWDEAITLHTHQPFLVYLLGFLPGFPYMGRLPAALHCTRKATPRLRVPACSVGLAGAQTGIYPVQAPGGWQVMGRTPIPVFQPDQPQPFRLQAGDRVLFYPITPKEYVLLYADVLAGRYQAEVEHG